MLDTTIRNARRNQSMDEFAGALMWFLENEDDVEKLGAVRMILCNLNSRNKESDPRISSMIATVQEMIESMRNQ